MLHVTARQQRARARSRRAMTIRALALVVLAIAARSATGADATEVNGDMAILELKRLQARRPNASPAAHVRVYTLHGCAVRVLVLLLPPVRAPERTPHRHAARTAHTHTPLSHSVRRRVVAHPHAQEEGRKPLVDALLQGTTALAVGHDPDGAAFAEHLASFDSAARGLAFHAVEVSPNPNPSP